MSKQSIIDNAKAAISIYDRLKFLTWGDEVVHDLISIIKDLIEELETSDQIFANFTEKIYFSSDRTRFVIGRDAYEKAYKALWDDAGYCYYGRLSSTDQIGTFLSGREAECLT